MAVVHALSHAHRFVPATGQDSPPLLLLHGTGGDENDLLPLGAALAPGAALLSPRGDVLENGMPRFFRRLAEGVFDEDDVRLQANRLADFVDDAREAYGIAAPVAVGFSNGANIAAATLLLRPRALSGAVLLRAMSPLKAPPPARLDGTRVLILSGAFDPIVRADDVGGLAAMLKADGAIVEHQTLPASHGLTQGDVQIAKTWLSAL
ncbi:MAG TPA: alpha/beta hydrolase [Hansschlegelia sp.]